MGYDTRYHLTWDEGDATPRRSCEHDGRVGAAYCDVCGARRHLTVSDAVWRSLGSTPLTRLSASAYGGEMSWYEREADMARVSRENPGVLFHLRGRGQDEEDIWDLFALDGRVQKHVARIERVAAPTESAWRVPES